MDPTVSFSAVHRSARLARSAGTKPKTRPVRTVMPSVNSKMRASGAGRMSSGFPSTGTSASNPRVMAKASAMPAAPPASDSTMLSTSNWRTNRPRVAPSDSRTEISFCLAKARAISRLATLAQAIRSTNPTMHINTISALEKSLRRPEYPVAAFSRCSVPFRNCSRE